MRITLFRAGSQLVKVRALMLLSLACAVGSVWWGFDLARLYGTSPGDGGMLAPLVARLAWGIGVASVGILFAVGMWLYGRCYVAKMELDRQADELHVCTVRFFGTKEQAFAMSDVSVGDHHEGRLDNYMGSSVNAPWTAVRLRGRSLPLIIDEQGEFPQGKLVGEVFRSASPPTSF